MKAVVVQGRILKALATAVDGRVLPFAGSIKTFSALQTLYIRRDVVNANEIREWAKAQGFSKLLEAHDMHVTICYSRQPVDWEVMRPSPTVPDEGITCQGGVRSVEFLGDKGAIVLKFECAELTRRWEELLDRGASWDYDGYHPHVTLTYPNPDGLNPADIPPYLGPIALGPEKLEKLDLDWADDVVENAYDPNQPRKPKGDPEGGQWTSTGETSPLTAERRARMTPEQLEEYKRKYRERAQRRRERQAEVELETKNEITDDGSLVALARKPGTTITDLHNRLREIVDTTHPYPHRVHGMPEENFYEAQLSAGQKLYFRGDAVHDAAMSVNRIAAANFPSELTRGTRAVYLSAQANPHDPFWAKQFNIPNFRATATANSVTMTIVLHNRNRATVGIMAHEYAHNMATSIHGSPTQIPPEKSPLARKWREWADGGGTPPTTKYGTVALGEGYAEAVLTRFAPHLASRETKKEEWDKAVDEELAIARDYWRRVDSRARRRPRRSET